jgi:hypothetical protein
MGQDQGRRPSRCHALALALVALEFASQVLSLSVSPVLDPAGLEPDTGSISAPSRHFELFLWNLLGLPSSDLAGNDNAQDDEDGEPSDWPKLELIARQKAPVPNPLRSDRLPPRRPFPRLTESLQRILAPPICLGPVQLCKLTC